MAILDNISKMMKSTYSDILKASFKGLVGSRPTPWSAVNKISGYKYATSILTHGILGAAAGKVSGGLYGDDSGNFTVSGFFMGAGLRAAGYRGIARPFLMSMGGGILGAVNNIKNGEFDYNKSPGLRLDEIQTGFRRGFRTGLTAWGVSMIPGGKKVTKTAPATGYANTPSVLNEWNMLNWWKWPLVAGTYMHGLSNTGYFETPQSNDIVRTAAVAGGIGLFGGFAGPAGLKFIASNPLLTAGATIAGLTAGISSVENTDPVGAAKRSAVISSLAPIAIAGIGIAGLAMKAGKFSFSKDKISKFIENAVTGIGTKTFNAANILTHPATVATSALALSSIAGGYMLPFEGAAYGPVGGIIGGIGGGMLAGGRGAAWGVPIGAALALGMAAGLSEEANIPAAHQSVIDTMHEIPRNTMTSSLAYSASGMFSSPNAQKGRGMPHNYLNASGDLVFSLHTLRDKKNPATYINY